MTTHALCPHFLVLSAESTCLHTCTCTRRCTVLSLRAERSPSRALFPKTKCLLAPPLIAACLHRELHFAGQIAMLRAALQQTHTHTHIHTHTHAHRHTHTHTHTHTHAHRHTHTPSLSLHLHSRDVGGYGSYGRMSSGGYMGGAPLEPMIPMRGGLAPMPSRGPPVRGGFRVFVSGLPAHFTWRYAPCGWSCRRGCGFLAMNRKVACDSRK